MKNHQRWEYVYLLKNVFLMVSIIGCIAITLHPEWRQLVAAAYDSSTQKIMDKVVEQQEDSVKERLEKLREEAKEKSKSELLESSMAGIFFTGTYGHIDREITSRENGFVADIVGLTVGGDYRINTDLVVGAALGFFHVDSEFSNQFADSKAVPVSFSIYSEFLPMDDAYINLMFDFTTAEVEYSRNIFDNSVIVDKAKSVFDANSFSANINSGYTWTLGGFSIGPQLTLSYSYVFNEDLVETSGGVSAQTVQGEINDSLKTMFGMRVAHAASLSWGVFSSEVGAFYVHEFMDKSNNLTITNRTTGAQSLFTTDAPDRDTLISRVGLVFIRPNGWNFFVTYEGLFAHSYMESHMINFGTRIEF